MPSITQTNEFFIAGHSFLRGVAKIGEQSEIDVVIAVGQVVDFERFQKALAGGLADQHGWHRDQRGMLGGNSVGEIKPGQAPWLNEHCCKPIDQGNAQLADT
jgi:hypothetical protein